MSNTKISVGFGNSPFGKCAIAWIDNKVLALTFPENENEALSDVAIRLHTQNMERNDVVAGQLITDIFTKQNLPEFQLRGTAFQLKVWHALQQIPVGSTTTYSEIAAKIGHPKAVRAVGTAIGANPIAYCIPCHRVLRADGGLGGFRWGLDLKKKLLKSEGVLV